MDEATSLDNPGATAAWQWLSRMHQIAMELNTDMRHSRGPILAAMFHEGLIDVKLRGTRANKRMVLAAMVETMREADPNYRPSASITRALSD